METIIVSIKSGWCKKIESGEKPIEVRKSAPGKVPFKALIYCTKGKPYEMTYAGGEIMFLNGKIIGEFVCDKVEEIDLNKKNNNVGEVFDERLLKMSCLTENELSNYLSSANGKGFAWHISKLKIYDIPKDLSEFGLKRAPQSWQHITIEKEGITNIEKYKDKIQKHLKKYNGIACAVCEEYKENE